MALTYSPAMDASIKMPFFELPTVQGALWSSKSIEAAPAKLVMFICAHCPYVQAIEGRLIDLGRELKPHKIPVVGICSNDAAEYPEDSPAALKKRWQEKNYSFDYLVDESQQVARDFGACCTPDFFVYDKNNFLTYRGRLDDSWQEADKVTRQELKQALLATAQGRAVATPIKPSMGCSIKWRK